MMVVSLVSLKWMKQTHTHTNASSSTINHASFAGAIKGSAGIGIEWSAPYRHFPCANGGKEDKNLPPCLRRSWHKSYTKACPERESKERTFESTTNCTEHGGGQIPKIPSSKSHLNNLLCCCTTCFCFHAPKSEPEERREDWG